MADLEGEESIEIDAPVERCFAIAADVESAPAWHGAMRSANVLERDAQGRAALVESEYDAAVTKVRVCLRFSYDEPHGMRWTRERGDLRSLEGGWELEELDDGRTRATYRLEIGLNRALSLLRKGVRGPAEARVRQLLARRPVEGLKERAESG
jgi:ribosome-associated toxin RatA of RatAB toxin-antitoxin module